MSNSTSVYHIFYSVSIPFSAYSISNSIFDLFYLLLSIVFSIIIFSVPSFVSFSVIFFIGFSIIYFTSII